MFTFTATMADRTVGGAVEVFALITVDGQKRLSLKPPAGETQVYISGKWTFWTSGVVAFQVDLDAENAVSTRS